MDKLIHQGVGLVDYQGDLLSALVSGVSDQHQQQEANSTSWGNCWIGWDWLDKWVQLIFFGGWNTWVFSPLRLPGLVRVTGQRGGATSGLPDHFTQCNRLFGVDLSICQA